MSNLTETMKVSKQVKKELDKIKEKEGHSSYDSVLRSRLGMNKPQ
jgi:hypothetical protein